MPGRACVRVCVCACVRVCVCACVRVCVRMAAYMNTCAQYIHLRNETSIYCVSLLYSAPYVWLIVALVIDKPISIRHGDMPVVSYAPTHEYRPRYSTRVPAQLVWA